MRADAAQRARTCARARGCLRVTVTIPRECARVEITLRGLEINRNFPLRDARFSRRRFSSPRDNEEEKNKNRPAEGGGHLKYHTGVLPMYPANPGAFNYSANGRESPDVSSFTIEIRDANYCAPARIRPRTVHDVFDLGPPSPSPHPGILHYIIAPRICCARATFRHRVREIAASVINRFRCTLAPPDVMSHHLSRRRRRR